MAINRVIYVPSTFRDGSLFSLLADQSTESFSDGGVTNLGIADDWSMSFWAINADETTTHFRLFESGEPGTANNQISIGRGFGDSETLWVRNESSTSAILKTFEYNGVWVTGEWRHVVFTWNGGANALLLYLDGVLTAPSVIDFDNNGTMDNPGATQNVGFGCKQVGGTRSWLGTLGHGAVWDVTLDQSDVDEIFNPTVGLPFGLDLLANTGTYDKSSSLIQYWKPGFDNTDVMRNYSIDVDAITFTTQERNAGEITEDAPA